MIKIFIPIYFIMIAMALSIPTGGTRTTDPAYDKITLATYQPLTEVGTFYFK